jgi:hypothetical protein
MAVAFDGAVVEEVARFSVFPSYPLGGCPSIGQTFFWLWFLAHAVTVSKINTTARKIAFLAISLD